MIDELGAVRGEPALAEHNQVRVPVPRTPLGIDAVTELPGGAGLRVAQVGAGSLAEQAGLAPGDVILEMSGVPVRTAAAARDVILEVRPGQDVPVTVERGGAPRQLLLRFPGDAAGAGAHRLPPPPDVRPRRARADRQHRCRPPRAACAASGCWSRRISST